MTARITKEGTYELFRDTTGKQVLKLDSTQLQLVQGPQNEVMASRHGTFDLDEKLDEGDFKFIEFDEEDGEDHRLLLQRTGDFRVVLFSEGLPEGPDEEVRCQMSEEIVGIDEVETYVASLRSAAAEGRDRLDGSDVITAIDHHFQSMNFPAEKVMLLDYARRRQAADEIIAVLERIDDGNYESVDELQTAVDDVLHADRLDLDDQSSDDLIELIEAMEPAELRDLKDYERRHANRNKILEAIERRLES